MPSTHNPEHEEPLNVEVDIDGAWHPGHLNSWKPRSDGLWANVTVQTTAGRIHDRTLPAHRVRPPTELP
jgi:hypothetical protein